MNTVFGPGEADATLLRLAGPGFPLPARGLHSAADANPSWCRIDPRLGTAYTVAESALNVACVGARPLALVNCLNFGNPEHPEVMWELSESVDGMSEACAALGIPVVGGNVSLYNESNGVDIDPTPVVAVVGLVERPPPATTDRLAAGRQSPRARHRARESGGFEMGHVVSRPPRRLARAARPRRGREALRLRLRTGCTECGTSPHPTSCTVSTTLPTASA